MQPAGVSKSLTRSVARAHRGSSVRVESSSISRYRLIARTRCIREVYRIPGRGLLYTQSPSEVSSPQEEMAQNVVGLAREFDNLHGAFVVNTLGWLWEYRNSCVIQGCCDKSPIWAPLRQSNLSLSQSYTPSRPDGSWRYMLQRRTA